MSFTTSLLYDDGVALVALAGELDLAVRDQLDSAVAQALEDGMRLVLVDLDGLVFCDSTGLGALLRASRLVKEAGGTCIVAGARDAVKRLLSLTSMEQVLTLLPEVQPALTVLRAAATEQSAQ